MTSTTEDDNIIFTLITRLEKLRLPRLVTLREKVDSGAKLADDEIDYLDRVISEANQISDLLERNPEYKELVARVMFLYKEITTKAVENERKN